jgi:hypothetical protein
MQSRSKQLFFALALLASSGVATTQTQNARIPTAHVTSFTGVQVTLPDDLRGRVGVLVLGFSKSSGDVCKGWGQRLAERYRESHEVVYYQMPVLEGVPKLIRGMVTKSIKSGVPEAEQSHFLPVFSDEAAWQKIARYSNADDAYILVVDGQGNVRWQTSGKVTDAGFAALMQQVETLRTHLSTAGR